MNNHNEATNSIVINILSEKQTIKSLTQHVLQLCALLETHDMDEARITKEILSQATPKHDAPRGRKPRDYGPTSQRKATRQDAWEILYGDRCNQKARQIADETGLSRGQVYSIQGGYTFRDVKLEEFGEAATYSLGEEQVTAEELVEHLTTFVGPRPKSDLYGNAA